MLVWFIIPVFGVNPENRWISGKFPDIHLVNGFLILEVMTEIKWYSTQERNVNGIGANVY